MANILSTNKYVIIPGKKSFVYYFDTVNDQFYIPWEQYETSKKLGIDIEGKPKIIQGRNCYSIHPEQLKELEQNSDFLGIKRDVQLEGEFKVKETKPSEDIKITLVAYQDATTKKIYLPIQYSGKETPTKLILDKPCTEVDIHDLEKMLNIKVIIITVYCKPNDVLTIPLCNIQDRLFIAEEIAIIFDIDLSNRRRIRVDGNYYVEVAENELPKIQIEDADVVFEKKEIYPVKKQPQQKQYQR